MPQTNQPSRINTQEVTARADSAQHVIIGFSRALPALADLWQQITHSLSDIPILAAEVTYLRGELALVRLRFANLAAAGCATLTAHHDGEDDPLFYLRDELASQGLWLPRRPA
jgi:hypothetical protein